MSHLISESNPFSAYPFLNDKSMLENGVKFVGIINDKGRLEGSVSAHELLLSNKQKEMFCMQLVLHNRMQQDLDEELSPVSYTITERGNSKLVVIPTKTSKLILGIMTNKTDHTYFVNKIMSFYKSVESFKASTEESR